MSLPTSLSRCAALLLACGAVPALAADTDSSVMYRCPGNDYKTTISAKEAERLGCKRIEGAPVTIMQMTKPRTAAPVPASAGSAARVDAVAQRARDSDARRILEAELKTEEDKLAVMQK
jgi:hypothetical protein